MSEDSKWLTQMHVFPEDADGEAEHDYPYEVQYNPEDGTRRTRKLTKDQVAEIREFNGLPAEEVRNADGDVQE